MPGMLLADRFIADATQPPPWHRLGQTFTGTITAAEATQRIKGDFTVDTHRLYVSIGDQYVELDTIMSRDSAGFRALLREPLSGIPGEDGYVCFNVVGKDYTTISAMDIAHTLDRVLESNGKNLVLDTCGALGRGEQIFWCIRDLHDSDVRGHQIRNYWTINDARDGLGSLSILSSDIRVVCANTLAMAFRAAATNITLRHAKGLRQETEMAASIMGGMKTSRDAVLAMLDRFGRTTITNDEIKEHLEQVYAIKPKPQRITRADEVLEANIAEFSAEELDALKVQRKAYEAHVRTMQRNREQAYLRIERYNDDTDHPLTRGTVFSAYQGVSEQESHPIDTKASAKAVAKSLMFGERHATISRSFSLLMAHVDANPEKVDTRTQVLSVPA